MLVSDEMSTDVCATLPKVAWLSGTVGNDDQFKALVH